jgi:uncharacterized membrane protein YfcA
MVRRASAVERHRSLARTRDCRPADSNRSAADRRAASAGRSARARARRTGWQIVAGVALGLCLGTASTFLGIAGGEPLIPTLIFVFGADIHTAGSAVLFISIPTVCMGLFRYGRIRLLPGRSTLLRIGLPMGIESFVGAAAGGAFAGTTSAEVLKLLLGVILIAATLKAFWRHQ